MPKIVPAITALTYLIPNGVSYIDLARDLSRVNRRLYRQGRYYAIESITIASGVNMRSSDVVSQAWYSSGNSYTVQKAWNAGYDAWNDQLDQYSDRSQRGRWDDFKIYLDDTMEDGTINDVYAGDGAIVQVGEDWSYAKLAFDDDGTEREFTMCLIGTSNLTDTDEESGIALIEEWADARPKAHAESPPMPGSWSNTIWAKIKGTDELTDMIYENLETDNDQAPYDFDDYYGGAVNGDAAHLERLIAVSGAEFTRTIPGFIAPCGLIKVSSEELSLTNTTESATDIGEPAATGQASPGPNSVYQTGTAPSVIAIVRVVPGPYKGVLAPSMIE